MLTFDIPMLMITYRHERSNKCGDDPYCDPNGHVELSGIPVAQIAEQRGEQHVGYDKGGLERSSLAIADLVMVLNIS